MQSPRPSHLVERPLQVLVLNEQVEKAIQVRLASASTRVVGRLKRSILGSSLLELLECFQQVLGSACWLLVTGLACAQEIDRALLRRHIPSPRHVVLTVSCHLGRWPRNTETSFFEGALADLGCH